MTQLLQMSRDSVMFTEATPDLRTMYGLISPTPQGKGTMKYVNGDIYSGRWANDKPHGPGKLVSRDKKLSYDGDWQAGKYHGYGLRERKR